MVSNAAIDAAIAAREHTMTRKFQVGQVIIAKKSDSHTKLTDFRSDPHRNLKGE
jgi:hypothetical protein